MITILRTGIFYQWYMQLQKNPVLKPTNVSLVIQEQLHVEPVMGIQKPLQVKTNSESTKVQEILANAWLDTMMMGSVMLAKVIFFLFIFYKF